MCSAVVLRSATRVLCTQTCTADSKLAPFGVSLLHLPCAKQDCGGLACLVVACLSTAPPQDHTPLGGRLSHSPCLQKVTQYALYYMDAQRVGTLPADNEVPYRSNALVYEESIGPANGDISGGWLEGGALGNLKMTVPTAFSTSLLAWGLIAFPTVSPLGWLILCSRKPKLTGPLS